MIITSSASQNNILFGCTENGIFVNGHGIAFDFSGYFYEGNLTSYTPTPKIGEKIEITQNYLNDGRGKISPIGVDIALNKATTYTQLTIAIFNFRGSDIATISRYAVKEARIYGMRFTRGEELILDLVPVVKNGVGYLFDTISERLFGNVGSGDFIVGPRK